MNGQIEGQLTLSQVDSRVSLLVLPGSKEARTMTVTSGQKWLGLSKNCGPLGLLEKMLLESSIWHSTRCYLTWKPQATPSGRFYYQLAVSMPRIGDTEQPLWATPNTMDYLPQRSPEALQRQAEGSRKGRKRPANLREQVNPETCRMWPTPTATDSVARKPGNPIMTKNGTVRHKNKAGGQSLMRLSQVVKLYATPQARDYRTGQKSRWESKERSRNLNDQIGGQLNPDWVEWLMGFPIGWTELNALETQ
ncbi:hypothetical protein SAMN05443270_1091 [Lacrimispora sphenoides]|nr:hypothetical protein SAMN05443270_1091 [Lacrimispora sphenoides]